MRIIPDDLKTHLGGEATTICHAWRVTRRDGTVLGFTDHDHDLAFDDTSFLAASGFEASDWESADGMSVAAGEVAGALTSEAIAEADVAAGKYDGARVEVFLVNWADSAQRVRLRLAEIGEVTRSQGFFHAELRGAAHKLDESRGRIYSRRCDAKFGDIRCGKNANSSDYRGTGTVTSADVNRMTVFGIDAFPAGFFRYGSVKFTSGANDGVTVDVESHRRPGGDAVIDFWLPMAVAPGPGDTFQITAGCDKTFETCKLKFSNQRNFRGFPHMPGADFSYSYADGETEHDGGPLYD